MQIATVGLGIVEKSFLKGQFHKERVDTILKELNVLSATWTE